MTPFIINDGYTEQGYIAAAGGIPEIRFSFRPTTQNQLNAYVERTSGKTATMAGAVEADMLAKKISEWNISNEDGSPWPITAANLLMLRGTIYHRLSRIVLFGGPSDTDPSVSNPDEKELQKILEAAEGVGASQKN